ncbi:putative thiol:disulfide interchange protein [Klebsiella quasipneumoniae]|uniref:disulfide isomerase DsbC N-terminal domain-containing protein n=1 Tax=Klebsiella quasipneumoniae TaxID=1463165 RepID=UPI0010E7E345|nr:disulfide isomerase DsbC N-terminal domain-containing protein [Klebsiella quasipneumoniae]VGG57251.1 putative thiol:disulfide interchange protein [Klebsiella quasipneumoniae]
MIKPIAVALILLTPSAYADVDLPAELTDKIEAVGINPVSAEKSPVSGIYSVFSKEGTSYVTSDGEYIFTGNLFKVKGIEVENTTDEFISKGMRSYIEKLNTITYKAPDEKYVIGVFTDITCGFCQKLHSDLQSYLDKGITIKFIAYPRAGMNSMIARNMASVWCADDKPAAFIIGGIFAYTQTKDSLENISVPDAEFPSSITRNNFMQSTWVNEHYTSLKNGQIADGISSILDDAQDIRGSVNNVVMTAGNVDIQKVIQDAVDELDNSSRKSSK